MHVSAVKHSSHAPRSSALPGTRGPAGGPALDASRLCSPAWGVTREEQSAFWQHRRGQHSRSACTHTGRRGSRAHRPLLRPRRFDSVGTHGGGGRTWPGTTGSVERDLKNYRASRGGGLVAGVGSGRMRERAMLAAAALACMSTVGSVGLGGVAAFSASPLLPLSLRAPARTRSGCMDATLAAGGLGARGRGCGLAPSRALQHSLRPDLLRMPRGRGPRIRVGQGTGLPIPRACPCPRRAEPCAGQWRRRARLTSAIGGQPCTH